MSTQFSNSITPMSVNRSRSQPSPASSRPSFLQFGTILENSIFWKMRSSSGIASVNFTMSFTSTPMRSQTSWRMNRSRICRAASKANS